MSEAHDSWDPMLAGSTELDTTDRRLTMHHNWISTIDSSAPMYRSGNEHVFNNVFQDVNIFAINTRLDACIRVENNVFSNANNPWVSAFSDVLGGVELLCNELDDSTTFDDSLAGIREPTSPRAARSQCRTRTRVCSTTRLPSPASSWRMRESESSTVPSRFRPARYFSACFRSAGPL